MNFEVSIAFQTNKTASDYIALARLVNQYDFDVVSVYCDAPFHPSYAPLLLMAPHIRKARIGPAAISPSRIHPIDIASQTALLSELAQGGVYVGLARGAWLNDHGILERRPPITAIKESIDIVQRLLTGESAGYTGKVFQIAEHVRATYPIPEAMPPILIGTWGQKLAQLAGQVAHEVKIGGSANPDFVPVMRRYIAEGERKSQRAEGTVGIVMGAVTVVDEDRNQARHQAKRALALYLPIVAPLDITIEADPELSKRIRAFVNTQDLDSAANLISDDLLDRFAFSGSPADIILQCEALFSAGTRRIEFGTPHGMSSINGIQLIGEKVIPALRQFRT